MVDIGAGFAIFLFLLILFLIILGVFGVFTPASQEKNCKERKQKENQLSSFKTRNQGFSKWEPVTNDSHSACGVYTFGKSVV